MAGKCATCKEHTSESRVQLPICDGMTIMVCMECFDALHTFFQQEVLRDEIAPAECGKRRSGESDEVWSKRLDAQWELTRQYVDAMKAL